MQDLSIPPGHQRVMPYLVLQDAQGFSAFMQMVFGCTEKYREMRDETKILHAELQFGEATVMFADSPDQLMTQNAGLFAYVKSPDETYAKALAEGATPVMEMADQTYGRSGGIKDPLETPGG